MANLKVLAIISTVLCVLSCSKDYEKLAYDFKKSMPSNECILVEYSNDKFEIYKIFYVKEGPDVPDSCRYVVYFHGYDTNEDGCLKPSDEITRGREYRELCQGHFVGHA